MCVLFKNVGKVITTKNSGRPPVQREFSLSRVLLWPQPRLDHRNPVVHWCSGTLKEDPRPDEHLWKSHSLISHHFHKESRRESYGESYFVRQTHSESNFREWEGRKHWLGAWMSGSIWSRTKPRISKSYHGQRDWKKSQNYPVTKIYGFSIVHLHLSVCEV